MYEKVYRDRLLVQNWNTDNDRTLYSECQDEIIPLISRHYVLDKEPHKYSRSEIKRVEFALPPSSVS